MKFILFDVDGVLIYSPPWSQEYARRTDIDPALMKPFFAGVFRECILGRADLKKVIVPFLSEWGWTGSVDEYLKSWFDFENRPDTELIEKIQALRKVGVKCYVATNQEKYRLEYLRNVMHFDELFDGIFCSAEMGVKKPDVEYYQSIIDSLRKNPDEILYFDDAKENVESARSLDIRGFLYTDIGDISFLMDEFHVLQPKN